ncbi:MAG: FKBP-type peptidyl-prolyl cis-trans isomerase [Deltaproteobacteria bacterium]|nr:FKBP-type peptidyl-prolyl cis-trans isomerase [Deltaproteobacteria bacterium]
MRIEKDRVVTLSYTLSVVDGDIIESSEKRGGPLRFVYGFSALLPGFDKNLDGLEKGHEREFVLEPSEAFGAEDSGPEGEMLRSEFPASASLEVGRKFAANLPDGGGPVNFVVLSLDSDQVKIRYLHPLAGKRIKAQVKVLEVRNATPTEIVTGEVEVPPPVPR